MKHYREIINHLDWNVDGKFEAVLVNGQITKLNFCEPGKGANDCGKCLTSTDFKYLQAVHHCLTELFKFIEDENRRHGYSYAIGEAKQSTEVKLPEFEEATNI
ncbi:MAG TPA: hypothetical protein VGN20_19290 [Mucilaginibacter sp.]|jgi:hypothetical protein